MLANANLQLVSAFSMYKRRNSSSDVKGKRKNSKHRLERKVASKTKSTKQHYTGIEKTWVRGSKKKSFAENSEIKLRHKSNNELTNGGTKCINAERSILKNDFLNKFRNHMQSPQMSYSEPKNFNEFATSDNPLLDAVQLFEWIIEPVSPDEFFQTYWEQKVLHLKRSNEKYYAHILNSSALDKIIKNHHLYYTQNVDVVCYENGVKEVHNSEGRATASALWDYYSNGCSIRILNPQTYSPKVHLLLSILQEYFGAMVGANVYLTPPGSQGFAPHYDDIEAFIVQLEGRKHWRLYQPKDSDVLARYPSQNLNYNDIGKPFMELTLNAGEILYFPRGTIHEGYTDSDKHSLHITVSVYQQTSYVDLLQLVLPAALQKACENEVEFRKGLPLNYLKNFGIAASTKNLEFKKLITGNVEHLMQSLIKYVDIDSAADSLGKKFMYDSMPPVLSKHEANRCSKADGPYLSNGQVLNKVQIDYDTRIRLLRYYCIRLIVDNQTSIPKLYYNTENANVYHGAEEQWLELDVDMIPSIRMLQNVYPSYIQVGDLPMEDSTLKMQLISSLWEHGIIVSEHPLNTMENE